MTALLKLIYTADYQADQDSLDLLSFADGFTLAENGWTPKIATGNQETIIETITLLINATSQDWLARYIHDLEKWVQKVNYSHDVAASYQVWLRVKDTFESEQRQAMVLEMSGILLDPHPALDFDTKDSTANYTARRYVLTVRRTPFWESLYPYAGGGDEAITGLSVIGGSDYLDASKIECDVPPRFPRVKFRPTETTPDTFLKDYWAGLRTSRYGVLANFVPVWALELSSNLGADAITGLDINSYSGTSVFNFLTSGAPIDWERVLTIKVDDVTANASDQRGTFNVLLRARVENSITSGVNLYMKYGLNLGVIKRPIVSITAHQYTLYELGMISIPYLDVNPSVGLSQNTISLYAERPDDDGGLFVDCLILIPVDESSIKALLVTDQAEETSVAVYNFADNKFSAFGLDETTDQLGIKLTAQQFPNQWSVPVNYEHPLLVVAAQGNVNGNKKGNTFSFYYDFIYRWRGLRGTQPGDPN